MAAGCSFIDIITVRPITTDGARHFSDLTAMCDISCHAESLFKIEWLSSLSACGAGLLTWLCSLEKKLVWSLRDYIAIHGHDP